MPVARASEHGRFDLGADFPGVTVTGLASPSRGGRETLLYRIDIEPGAALPSHTHDHEEVFVVVHGSVTSIQDEDRLPAAEGDAVMIHAGVKHHAVANDEGATLIVAMPVGTILITPAGERRTPPWTE